MKKSGRFARYERWITQSHLDCPMEPTFRERYCAFHGIPVEEFEDHLLPRGLYPHARALRAVLRSLPEYFAPEREFLRSAGNLRTRRLYPAEVAQFYYLMPNQSVSRRLLRLRISTERVRHHMEACWGTLSSPSVSPFATHLRAPSVIAIAPTVAADQPSGSRLALARENRFGRHRPC